MAASSSLISPRGEQPHRITAEQRSRRETVQLQLRGPNGTQDVLFLLLSILDEVTNHLEEDIQLRSRSEAGFEADLLDISQRLRTEVRAREALKHSVEEAVKIESSLLSEVELLRSKLKFLVDRTSFSVEDETEDMDLRTYTDSIEQGLLAARTLLDVGKARAELGPQLRKLHNRVNNENASRLELEARSSSLESSVEELSRKIEAERQASAELRKLLQQEVTAREALTARMASKH